jgi:osmoprotectant transport system substrate-binding protein
MRQESSWRFAPAFGLRPRTIQPHFVLTEGTPVKITRTLVVVPVVAALLLSACGGDESSSADTGVTIPKITLGVTTDPESRLLGELYAQSLEGAGYRVSRKTPYADEAALYAAVAAGEVQLAPQLANSLLRSLDESATPISGSVVTTIPNTLPPAVADTTTTAAADATTTTVAPPPDPLADLRAALPSTLTVGETSKAVHAQVVACNTALESLAAVTSISELAKVAGDLRLGGPEAFETATPFGLPALADGYEATFKEFVAVNDDTLGEKILAGDLDCGVFESTDSDIVTASLTIMVDDLALAPIDPVLPLLTTPAATADALAILNSVSGAISTTSLNQMLAQITVAEVDPGVVAKTFLSNTGP